MGPPRPVGLLPPALENELVVAAGEGYASRRSMPEWLGRLRRLGGLAANSLVVAVLSPCIALLVGWVPRILLAIVILDIPLQFGGNFYDRLDDAAFGAYGGLSLSVTTIALAGLYASWFLKALASKNREAGPSVQINLPLTLYLAFSGLSLVVAQDVALSLFEVFLFLQMYLVSVYVANSVRTRQDVSFVVSLLLIGCVVESLIIIVLRFTGLPSTLWGLPTHVHVITDVREGFMRVGGTVGSPNNAGGYLSLLLAPAATLLLASPRRAHKWLATAVLGLGGVALILTFSRGGWLAFAASMGMLFLILWYRRGFSLAPVIALIVVLALLYLPFHDVISVRLLGDDRGAAESRIPLMRLAFRIIEDNPLLGVGSNNFPLIMDRYLTSEFRHGFLYTVHNKFLLICAEIGILGLLAYLAFLLGTVRKGWRCSRLSDPLLSPLALGFTVALAGHMLHMGVEVFRGRPVTQLLWLVAGLLAAMYRICVRPLSSDPLSSIT